jgi:hypothetical protein
LGMGYPLSPHRIVFHVYPRTRLPPE